MARTGKKRMDKLKDSDNVWADEIREAIRAFDYEKALRLMAANDRDCGNIESLITHFCSEMYNLDEEPDMMKDNPGAKLVKKCTLAIFKNEDGTREIASDVPPREVLSYIDVWIRRLRDVLPDD